MEPPEKPDPQDCCNSGCSPCINDIYEENLRKYNLFLEGKLQFKDPIVKKNILSQTKFTQFLVLFIEHITEDHKIITFTALDNNDRNTLIFSPGQHFILQYYVDGKASKKLSRAYTPLALKYIVANNKSYLNHLKKILENTHYFQIVIKLYKKGKMSTYLSNLNPGTVTMWRGPYGLSNYEANKSKYLFMLCHGTGIAPLISIANSIVNDEFDDTIIILFCCFKNFHEILMREDLYEMRQHWNFSYKMFLSKSMCSCIDELNECCKSKAKYLEPIINRRLNDSDVLDIINERTSNINVFICGSVEFMTYYKKLLDCHIDENKIKLF